MFEWIVFQVENKQANNELFLFEDSKLKSLWDNLIWKSVEMNSTITNNKQFLPQFMLRMSKKHIIVDYKVESRESLISKIEALVSSGGSVGGGGGVEESLLLNAKQLKLKRFEFDENLNQWIEKELKHFLEILKSKSELKFQISLNLKLQIKKSEGKKKKKMCEWN